MMSFITCFHPSGPLVEHPLLSGGCNRRLLIVIEIIGGLVCVRFMSKPEIMICTRIVICLQIASEVVAILAVTSLGGPAGVGGRPSVEVMIHLVLRLSSSVRHILLIIIIVVEPISLPIILNVVGAILGEPWVLPGLARDGLSHLLFRLTHEIDDCGELISLIVSV